MYVHLCTGSVYGSDTCRALVPSRGPRARCNAKYQTLPPQQRRHADERTQPLISTATHCADQRRLVAADTGRAYGRRSSSDADGGNCNRRRQLLYAVSDVDLTSCVDRRDSAAWKHPPSVTDLSSTANDTDQCEVMFGGLLHGGQSLQTLPDTHVWNSVHCRQSTLLLRDLVCSCLLLSPGHQRCTTRVSAVYNDGRDDMPTLPSQCAYTSLIGCNRHRELPRNRPWHLCEIFFFFFFFLLLLLLFFFLFFFFLCSESVTAYECVKLFFKRVNKCHFLRCQELI